MKRILFFIVLATALISVGVVGAQEPALTVVATTSIVADVAQNVGGDLVSVTSIIPPNADVHAFEPSPADVQRVADADVVLSVGAGLESFLGGLVENAAAQEPIVISIGIEMLAFGDHEHEAHEGEEAAEGEHEHEHAEAEFVGVLGDAGVCEEAEHHEEEAAEGDHEHEHGSCDPHVWTDPNNVKVWAANIAEAFASADAANAETYRANAAAYIEQLTALDAEVSEILAGIPEERRVLVTNHEFLGYFAHHYGFEVVGVVVAGGSSMSETDPQTLAALIDVVNDEQVPAIFAEISANPQLAEVIASEANIEVVTAIYSDSLGEPGSPAGTYLDYLRYNAEVIAEALS